jgi:hypothetical protein
MTIKILHVEREKVPSREVTGQVPAKASTFGIVSVDAQCDCGEIWESTKLGRGSFKLGINQLAISCPRCGSNDKVSGSDIAKVA